MDEVDPNLVRASIDFDGWDPSSIFRNGEDSLDSAAQGVVEAGYDASDQTNHNSEERQIKNVSGSRRQSRGQIFDESSDKNRGDHGNQSYGDTYSNVRSSVDSVSEVAFKPGPPGIFVVQQDEGEQELQQAQLQQQQEQQAQKEQRLQAKRDHELKERQQLQLKRDEELLLKKQQEQLMREHRKLMREENVIQEKEREEARLKFEEEQKEMKDEQERLEKERLESLKIKEDKLKKQEQQRLEKLKVERKKKEKADEERQKRETEERLREEVENEQLKREDEERLKREEEEQRLNREEEARIEVEEAARLKIEAEERSRRIKEKNEEADRLSKEKEAKLQKDKEDRMRKEDEDRLNGEVEENLMKLEKEKRRKEAELQLEKEKEIVLKKEKDEKAAKEEVTLRYEEAELHRRHEEALRVERDSEEILRVRALKDRIHQEESDREANLAAEEDERTTFLRLERESLLAGSEEEEEEGSDEADDDSLTGVFKQNVPRSILQGHSSVPSASHIRISDTGGSPNQPVGSLLRNISKVPSGGDSCDLEDSLELHRESSKGDCRKNRMQDFGDVGGGARAAAPDGNVCVDRHDTFTAEKKKLSSPALSRTSSSSAASNIWVRGSAARTLQRIFRGVLGRREAHKIQLESRQIQLKIKQQKQRENQKLFAEKQLKLLREEEEKVKEKEAAKKERILKEKAMEEHAQERAEMQAEIDVVLVHKAHKKVVSSSSSAIPSRASPSITPAQQSGESSPIFPSQSVPLSVPTPLVTGPGPGPSIGPSMSSRELLLLQRKQGSADRNQGSADRKQGSADRNQCSADRNQGSAMRGSDVVGSEFRHAEVEDDEDEGILGDSLLPITDLQNQLAQFGTMIDGLDTEIENPDLDESGNIDDENDYYQNRKKSIGDIISKRSGVESKMQFNAGNIASRQAESTPPKSRLKKLILENDRDHYDLLEETLPDIKEEEIKIKYTSEPIVSVPSSSASNGNKSKKIGFLAGANKGEEGKGKALQSNLQPVGRRDRGPVLCGGISAIAGLSTSASEDTESVSTAHTHTSNTWNSQNGNKRRDVDSDQRGQGLPPSIHDLMRLSPPEEGEGEGEAGQSYRRVRGGGRGGDGESAHQNIVREKEKEKIADSQRKEQEREELQRAQEMERNQELQQQRWRQAEAEGEEQEQKKRSEAKQEQKQQRSVEQQRIRQYKQQEEEKRLQQEKQQQELQQQQSGRNRNQYQNRGNKSAERGSRGVGRVEADRADRGQDAKGVGGGTSGRGGGGGGRDKRESERDAGNRKPSLRLDPADEESVLLAELMELEQRQYRSFQDLQKRTDGAPQLLTAAKHREKDKLKSEEQQKDNNMNEIQIPRGGSKLPTRSGSTPRKARDNVGAGTGVKEKLAFGPGARDNRKTDPSNGRTVDTALVKSKSGPAIPGPSAPPRKRDLEKKGGYKGAVEGKVEGKTSQPAVLMKAWTAERDGDGYGDGEEEDMGSRRSYLSVANVSRQKQFKPDSREEMMEESGVGGGGGYLQEYRKKAQERVGGGIKGQVLKRRHSEVNAIAVAAASGRGGGDRSSGGYREDEGRGSRRGPDGVRDDDDETVSLPPILPLNSAAPKRHPLDTKRNRSGGAASAPSRLRHNPSSDGMSAAFESETVTSFPAPVRVSHDYGAAGITESAMLNKMGRKMRS